MSSTKWCGRKSCSKCEEVNVCEVANELACPADCYGFIEVPYGIERRSMEYCFTNCDSSKIRDIMKIEGKKLSEVFDKQPNTIQCAYCKEVQQLPLNYNKL